MFNPASILQFRKDWGEFEQRHPKFVTFLGAIFKNGISEGSVVEIKITLPDGKEIESNMVIKAEDIEFFKNIGNMSVNK